MTWNLGLGTRDASAAGRTSAEFLRFGAGARASGMAESGSASCNDASCLYWNPAGLTELPKTNITLMHTLYVEGSYYDYLAWAGKGENYGWGASLQYLSAGSIDQTDETGVSLGKFSPSDLAFSLGAAHKIAWGYSLGLSAKFIRSKIIDTAEAFAGDASVLSPGYFNDRLRLSLGYFNLGTSLRYENVKESLPSLLRFGSSFKLSPSLHLALDVTSPKSGLPYSSLGAQWSLNQSLSLRGGVNSRNLGGSGGLSGITLGIGRRVKSLAFDYAFVPLGDLGSTHRVSLGLGW